VEERFLLGYFFAGICPDFSEEGGKAFYFRLRRGLFFTPPSFGGQALLRTGSQNECCKRCNRVMFFLLRKRLFAEKAARRFILS
jgi:hypothetical protein